MMNLFAIAAFLGTGLILFVWRKPIAFWQGMTIGARTPPGCVIAEAVVFVLLALAVLVLRPY